MVIKKWKLKLIILLIVTFVLTYGIPWLLSGQVAAAQAKITLTFEGIGRGLDPNGERFDINEIKSDAVLSKALTDTGRTDQAAVEQLRRNISISPLASREALGQITAITTVSGKTEDVMQKIVYPNEYIISIKGLDRKLFNNVTASYTDYLKSKYIMNFNAEPVYTRAELMALDYPEMISVLQQEADALVRYAEIFANNYPDFISKESGLSFTDLYEQALTVRDADVGNLQSMAQYFSLTKNIADRLRYEEIVLKRANLILSKASGREYTVADIITLYDNNSNYVFASEEFPQINLEEQKNEFYDSLMEQLVESKTESIDARYRVADIQRAMQKLIAPSLSAEAYAARSQELADGVNAAFDRIEETNGLIQAIAAENYDLNVGSKITIAPAGYSFYSWGNFPINLIILAVIWYLGALLWSFLKNKKYTSRKKR